MRSERVKKNKHIQKLRRSEILVEKIPNEHEEAQLERLNKDLILYAPQGK